MSDLQKLIEAVEAGTTTDSHIAGVFSPNDIPSWRLNQLARDAYNGSLDAALRLHEALLPGWHMTDMWLNGDGLISGAGVWREGVRENEAYRAHAVNPARAWLLAILRALAAQQPDEVAFSRPVADAVKREDG